MVCFQRWRHIAWSRPLLDLLPWASIYKTVRRLTANSREVLEEARLGVIMIVSLCNLTGISAALLSRCLSNCRAIGKFYTRVSFGVSLLRDFARSFWKTPVRLVNRGPVAVKYLQLTWRLGISWWNRQTTCRDLSNSLSDISSSNSHQGDMLHCVGGSPTGWTLGAKSAAILTGWFIASIRWHAEVHVLLTFGTFID